MFLLISDDKDGAKLTIGSYHDNLVNRYEYVRDGNLTSDIEITDHDFNVGTPVVTYTNSNYSKTTSVTVSRVAAALARG